MAYGKLKYGSLPQLKLKESGMSVRAHGGSCMLTQKMAEQYGGRMGGLRRRFDKTETWMIVRYFKLPICGKTTPVDVLEIPDEERLIEEFAEGIKYLYQELQRLGYLT